jgi:hypothetical protein
MNNTKDLLTIKSSRPDAYKTLATLAGSMKYLSVKYNTERRLTMIHTYGIMKIALLKQSMHKGNFLNNNYLDIMHPLRTKECLHKYLTQRDLRRWKKANKVTA